MAAVSLDLLLNDISALHRTSCLYSFPSITDLLHAASQWFHICMHILYHRNHPMSMTITSQQPPFTIVMSDNYK